MKNKLNMFRAVLPAFARVAIQNKEGKFLLVKNKKGGWNFPGGKVEDNEDPTETVKRETYEETNLQIKDLEKIAENIFNINDLWINNEKWRGYFYQTRDYSGEIINKEKNKILEIKFWDYKNILTNQQVNDITKFFLKSTQINIETPKDLSTKDLS